MGNKAPIEKKESDFLEKWNSLKNIQ